MVKKWYIFLTHLVPSTRLQSRKGFFGHPRIGRELSPFEGPPYGGPSVFKGVPFLRFPDLGSSFRNVTLAADRC